MNPNRRLDLALIARYAHLSRRAARAAIEKGQVTVDGTVVVEAGQSVALTAEVRWDPNRKAVSRARSSIPVLYRDSALLVVDKPTGLLSVPTSGGGPGEDTALARAAEYARFLKPHRPYLGLVHRLDRDTSGSLAFALTPEARQALRSLFRAHRIERRYSALVLGSPRSEGGTVDLPIRDAYRDGQRGVARPGEASRTAITHWQVVERFPGASLIDVRLETGRQHQIRIHLAAVGLPIAGDPKYRPAKGSRLKAPVRRLMLHARRLSFEHPLTGQTLRIESPLPEDFLRVLAVLRRARRSGRI